VDDAERFEGLLEVLAALREANEERPVVVEGSRDVVSLRLLGLEGHIIPLHSGDPLFQVAESIAAQADEVILLTDWDAKGQTLFEQLRAALAANGVKVDGAFRDDIRHAIRPTLKDVESLAGHVQRGLERYHGKDLADLRWD
jgi:5S rRNA maturation endonuclease (ribonuclease M5)